MPIATLAELFAAGAQHTVEGVLERFADAGINQIADALRRRFGPELTADTPTISTLTGRVARAMTTADEINNRRQVTLPYATVPGQSSEYVYHVLIHVPRVDEQGRVIDSVEVPYTLPSTDPLNIEQIRARVDQLLSAWDPPRDTAPGGQLADLNRRDVLIRSIMSDYGPDVTGIATTDVFSVYERA